MQTSERQRYYSPEEYLELEEAADYKSEYIDGKMVSMTGGTTNHNQIALNFGTELNFAFKQQDYRIFMLDVRLWIPKKRIFTYPDVMIVVGEPEYYNNRSDTITNPQVIIEVLSKSTKGYDREEKFEAYRTITTFQEYILIDQTRIHIEQFSKTANKQWSLREYDEEDEAIALSSVSVQMSILDVYNKVKFEPLDSNDN
ncbi:MAG: Uma2 family endonuclease [Cyanosarcina radialis HA8281-LM2]|jgi:Uma2 family endonuclease|nr:Uma2 family endonuclease [Cyanosarcina radialis HA8281-LM2]